MTGEHDPELAPEIARAVLWADALIDGARKLNGDQITEVVREMWWAETISGDCALCGVWQLLSASVVAAVQGIHAVPGHDDVIGAAMPLSRMLPDQHRGHGVEELVADIVTWTSRDPLRADPTRGLVNVIAIGADPNQREAEFLALEQRVHDLEPGYGSWLLIALARIAADALDGLDRHTAAALS